jgi:chemotaxis protein MotB
MPRTKKNTEPEDAQSAPEWMVTFSDCMTLLLTFFVLLLSFSSFDDKVFRKMETALAEAMPSIGISMEKDRDAFLTVRQIQYKEELNKGNEKPTLKGNIEANVKEDVTLMPFQNRKVFLISSDKVFWGKGTFISARGRKILSDIASLLKTVPNRIAISENNQTTNKKSINLGLDRAWAVTEYLTEQEHLDKNRFSVSAASTIPQQDLSDGQVDSTRSEGRRMLEIVILERSIYD